MKFKEHSDVPRPDWLGEAWHDDSWHNDALPHCSLFLTPNEDDGPVVECWVNWADPKEREIPPRYIVDFMRSYTAESGWDASLYEGEDEEQAKLFVQAAEIAKTIIADIWWDAKLSAAKTFSELHDYCDANMLGAQATIVDESGDVNEWADVLNAAQDIVDIYLRTRK